MLGLLAGKVLLGGEAFKGVGDHPRAQSRRDLARAVSGVGVNHHNLIGAGKRADGARDVGAFVVSDDGGGNGWHGGSGLAVRRDEAGKRALRNQAGDARNVSVQGPVFGDVRRDLANQLPGLLRQLA